LISLTFQHIRIGELVWVSGALKMLDDSIKVAFLPF
jgi:hypothetical protein